MSLLASVSNNLKFWDFNDNNLLLNSTADFSPPDKASAYTTDLLALAWNHNHKVIAVGGSGQKLHLVQANSGQILSSLPIDEKDYFVGDIRALSFSHNSRYLASAIEQDVAVWDLKTRNIRVRLRGHKSTITSLQFVANEGAVVSGDTSGALVLWNVDQNTHTKELLNPGYRSPLLCLKLSPGNNSHVCCGYGDGSVTAWDTQTLTPLNRCITAHETAVTAIACSPKNDRLVASGSKDGNLQLVDLGIKHDKFTPVVPGIRVGEEISSISFHENALYTAVGTETGYIYIYDWRNSQKPVVQVAGHNPMRVHDLAFQVCVCS